MCGIIGIISKEREVAPMLLEGIRRISYRGYDSCGMSVKTGGKIITRKDRGKVDEVDKRLRFTEMKGNTGIAHTRWATHGVPNKINAHPHADCKNEISIVHNGIIENFAALKKLLLKEGHEFRTETDTEVLAHLVEKFYDGKLEDAARKALLQVQGTYGIAILSRKEDKIVAARNGSPLILGIGNGEMFVVSDAAGIVEHTKKVVYLQDKEIAILTKNGFQIKDLENKKKDHEIEEIKWSLGQIEKSGFKHFMLKEIFEQPESIRNTLRGRLKERIKLSVRIDVPAIRKIVITACGTSWHAGLIGKYFIESLAGIPTEVDYASVFSSATGTRSWTKTPSSSRSPSQGRQRTRWPR